MNPLSTIITAAVADAVAGNPKLFDPKKIERATEVLSRDIVKALTRSTKDGEADAPAAAEPPAVETLAATDPRAKAYVNLRSVAGCFARPTTNAASEVYVPRPANTAAVLAMAEIPAPTEWRKVTKAQQTAWHEFFDRTLGDANRRPIGDATLLPWPWPPSKDGQVYSFEAQQEMPAP